MKGRFNRAIRFLCAAIAAVGIMVILLRPQEPIYQGRTLKGWLAELEDKSSQRREEAKAALHEIGSNAVPTLLTIVRSKDSSLKRIIAEWVNRQPAMPIRVTTDVQWKARAWAATQII